jgi:AraC family transcriptional regulator, regulatory protein of adaptative response / DNA-3-methyladenine glycosylase II
MTIPSTLSTIPEPLDFDVCYRALCSRDARFDGRFFTAVTTTGIYCRPICPARTPRADHVIFYRCAAAAEAAGFRACRRCRPETSPGSPEWNARGDLVARALRLIAEGAVDAFGVTGLAERLAVSERHLHRLLVAELGVGALALARTRRAQTSRLLIDHTNLSLTEIAFLAGFASIRQFNTTMREAFGGAPSQLRRREVSANAGAGWIAVRMNCRPPFAGGTLLAFLARRAIPGVESVADGCYRRAMLLRHGKGIMEVTLCPGSPHVLLRLRLDDLRDLNLIVQRCRQLFDLDADPMAIAAVLESDPTLAPLIAANPGVRVPGAADGFELAVRAILGQQISVAGARTLAGRLVAALGTPLAAPEGQLTHTFPTPAAIAQAPLAMLQSIGLTQQRSMTLSRLAQACAQGDLMLDRGADVTQALACLRAIPGIGPWTAAYIAMRALGDPDAWPAGDLGLRRAWEQCGAGGDLAVRAEGWRPWRAYAAMYLWGSLADIPQSAVKRKAV